MLPGTIIMLDGMVRAERVGSRLLQRAAALHCDLIHRFRLGIALGYQAPMLMALATLAKAAPIIELRRIDDLDQWRNQRYNTNPPKG